MPTESAAPQQDARASFLSQFWFPLLVLVVSLLATFFVWHIIERGIIERAGDRFEAEATDISTRLIKRLHDHEQVLLGGNALFHVKGDTVSRIDWRHYVSALKLSENHPGILGVGYSVWLTPEQKEENLRQVRAEGYPEYFIRPAGERPVYTSIIWLEPFSWRNQRAFGYDMYSEPVRRKAMDMARDTGKTTITARIQLVQETEQDPQHGMLMYVPSYRQAMPIDTVDERRAALRGFVYSPIRMNDFILGTLASLPAHMDFGVHSGESPSPDNLIFSSRHVEQRVLPTGYQPRFSSVKTLEAYGTTWHFVFSSLPAFDQELNQNRSTAMLYTGILSSILLSALAALQAHSRRQALTTAEQLRVSKQAAEAAKADAEQANQAKSDFLATMSHEIRTPMVVFMGAIEQLKCLDQNPTHRRLLDLADQASNRLHVLVNEILDFSKIEAGCVEIEETWLPLHDCLRETVAMLTVKAKKKDLLLELEISPAVPELIAGDQYRLGQVLINLIGNAIKFTERGKVKVAVDRREDLLHFTVSDTGIGVPVEKQQQIFGTFCQADSSSTRRYGGTGLGLAISKGLVELMGGTIGVSSSPGVGSEFSFTLPLKHPPVHEPAGEGENRPASATAAEARILLVEDNPMFRDVILLTLSRRKWPTSVAETGQEAVHQWQSGSFDLILMDLQMPGMDGVEATREIRSQESGTGRRISIIGLTAHANSQAQQECLAAGMDEFLVKPFESATLYAAVERCLARRETPAVQA
jgi:signal transduction histidine kinase/ActR/RegA family two-component response regulator